MKCKPFPCNEFAGRTVLLPFEKFCRKAISYVGTFPHDLRVQHPMRPGHYFGQGIKHGLDSRGSQSERQNFGESQSAENGGTNGFAECVQRLK